MAEPEYCIQPMVYGQEVSEKAPTPTVVHYQSAEDCTVSEKCFEFCNPEELIRLMGSTTARILCDGADRYNAAATESMVTIRAKCNGPKKYFGLKGSCRIRYETNVAPAPNNTNLGRD